MHTRLFLWVGELHLEQIPYRMMMTAANNGQYIISCNEHSPNHIVCYIDVFYLINIIYIYFYIHIPETPSCFGILTFLGTKFFLPARGVLGLQDTSIDQGSWLLASNNHIYYSYLAISRSRGTIIIPECDRILVVDINMIRACTFCLNLKSASFTVDLLILYLFLSTQHI